MTSKTYIYDKENIAKSVYSFDSFITCEENYIAFSAVKAVARSPKTAYNPLFIYGEHGTGKTHLLKAIEKTITECNPDLNVLYVTTETFINEVLEAIRCGDCCEIRDLYRSQDVLLVDDIHLLVGKEATLNEMINTIESLLQDGCQIVITANKAPRKLDVDEALTSRMSKGLVVELKAPDKQMKTEFIRWKVGERGVFLRDDVIDYISSNVGPNVNDIEGAITSIIAYSELMRPVISLDIAKKVLKDVIAE